MAELSSSSSPLEPKFVRSNIFIGKFMPAFMLRIEEAKNSYRNSWPAAIAAAIAAASSGNGNGDGEDYWGGILNNLFSVTVEDMTSVIREIGLEQAKRCAQDIIITIGDDGEEEEEVMVKAKVKVDDDRNDGGHHLEAAAHEGKQKPVVVVEEKKINVPTITTNDGVAGTSASGGGSGQSPKLDVPEGGLSGQNKKNNKKKAVQSPGRSASSRRTKLSSTSDGGGDCGGQAFDVLDDEGSGQKKVRQSSRGRSASNRRSKLSTTETTSGGGGDCGQTSRDVPDDEGSDQKNKVLQSPDGGRSASSRRSKSKLSTTVTFALDDVPKLKVEEEEDITIPAISGQESNSAIEVPIIPDVPVISEAPNVPVVAEAVATASDQSAVVPQSPSTSRFSMSLRPRRASFTFSSGKRSYKKRRSAVDHDGDQAAAGPSGIDQTRGDGDGDQAAAGPSGSVGQTGGRGGQHSVPKPKKLRFEDSIVTPSGTTPARTTRKPTSAPTPITSRPSTSRPSTSRPSTSTRPSTSFASRPPSQDSGYGSCRIDFDVQEYSNSIPIVFDCPKVGLCDWNFIQPGELVAHLERKHGIHEFVCLVPDCGQSFKAKTDLNIHLIEAHARLSRFNCGYCADYFRNHNLLEWHHTHHHQLGRFLCGAHPHCEFEGVTRRAVQLHVEASNGVNDEEEEEDLGAARPRSRAGDQQESGDKPVFRCKKENCGFMTYTHYSATRHIKTRHLTERERGISACVLALLDDPRETVATVQSSTVRAVSFLEDKDDLDVKPIISGKVAMKKPLGRASGSNSVALVEDGNGPLNGGNEKNQQPNPYRPFPIIKEESLPEVVFRSIAEMNNTSGSVAAAAVRHPFMNDEEEQSVEVLPDIEFRHISKLNKSAGTPSTGGKRPSSGGKLPSTGIVAAGAAVRPFNDDEDSDESEEEEQLPEIEFRHVSELYKSGIKRPRTGGKQPMTTPRSRPFKCSQCTTTSSYGTEIQLHKHINSVHQGKKPFGCKWRGCDYWCACRSNIMSHIKAHLKAIGTVFEDMADADRKIQKYLSVKQELL